MGEGRRGPFRTSCRCYTWGWLTGQAAKQEPGTPSETAQGESWRQRSRDCGPDLGLPDRGAWPRKTSPAENRFENRRAASPCLQSTNQKCPSQQGGKGPRKPCSARQRTASGKVVAIPWATDPAGHGEGAHTFHSPNSHTPASRLQEARRLRLSLTHPLPASHVSIPSEPCVIHLPSAGLLLVGRGKGQRATRSQRKPRKEARQGDSKPCVPGTGLQAPP